MLPGHLVAQFWCTVEQQLRKAHRLTKEQARVGIADFRKRTDLRIGEVIYNRDPEDVAETVAAFVRNGGFDVLDPLPETDSGPTRAVS